MSFKDFAGQGLTAAATTPLQILDVAPPAFDVSVSPAILWPPNHKFVDVTATVTSRDNCDPTPTVTLVSITSNEPEDKKDPGHSRRRLRHRRSDVLAARRARHRARRHGKDLYRHLPRGRQVPGTRRSRARPSRCRRTTAENNLAAFTARGAATLVVIPGGRATGVPIQLDPIL